MRRWLYHARIATADPQDSYAPPSLASEGFVHCSFAPALRETVALYYAGCDMLEVLQIDPRELDVRIEVADTPRGPMPHVHGPIPRPAITARWPIAGLPATLPDQIEASP